MEINPILQNVLAPPVLFFLIGAISVLFKSDLEIPAPLPKLFSLYLLLAIGFKGGIEIQKSGFTDQVLPTLSAAILMSLVIPLIGFLILRFKFDVFNSAAIAAAYGSISAVTFISAEKFAFLKISLFTPNTRKSFALKILFEKIFATLNS